jgi:hypothetical protein
MKYLVRCNNNNNNNININNNKTIRYTSEKVSNQGRIHGKREREKGCNVNVCVDVKICKGPTTRVMTYRR